MARHNILHSSPKIQQPVRLIECNEEFLNLMNTTILKDSIEKEKRKHDTFV